MLNPCLDTNYVTITMASALEALTYEIDSGSMPQTAHGDFLIATTPVLEASFDLCGELTVVGLYNDNPI